MNALSGAFRSALEALRVLPAPSPPENPMPPSSDPPEALAADFAASFEGCVLHPYRDAVGVWTIGYGSTHDALGAPVTGLTPCITEPQARALMVRDMGRAVAEATRDVKVPLTANECAALADFIYNLGAGSFRSSTLLRLLNAGDYEGAAAEFDKWDHAGGVVLAGLLRRRQAETDLFRSA